VEALTKILPLLFLGIAILNIFFGVLLVYIGFEEAMRELVFAGISSLFTGALYLYIAHGLRKEAKWAWVVGVIMLAFMIASSLLLASIIGAIMYGFLLALMVLAAPYYGIGVEAGELEKQVVQPRRRFVVRKK